MKKTQVVQRPARELKPILLHILCYSLWVVTVALAFLNLIVARNLYLIIMSVASVPYWTIGALDKLLFIAAGVVWLVLTIFTEHYYRTGIPENSLWKRFSLFMGIQLLFLFTAHLLPSLLVGVRNFTWWEYLLFTGELGGGLLLLFAALYSSSDSTSLGKSKGKNWLA